jgi:hypothetical protein
MLVLQGRMLSYRRLHIISGGSCGEEGGLTEQESTVVEHLNESLGFGHWEMVSWPVI